MNYRLLKYEAVETLAKVQPTVPVVEKNTHLHLSINYDKASNYIPTQFFSCKNKK